MTLHTHSDQPIMGKECTRAVTSTCDALSPRVAKTASGKESETDSLVQADGDQVYTLPDRRGEIGLYLQDIARIPALTAAEEKQLARRIKRGRLAQKRLARHSHTAETRADLESVIGEGREARNQLVTATARLVVFLARQYVGRGVLLADLVQEGNVGLMEAAAKFDPTRGYRFSTYAAWWVRHYVRRAIANQGRAIRLPVGVGAELRRLFHVSQQLVQAQGRGPTPGELAQAMQLPVEKVNELLQVAYAPLSLEQPVGEAGDNLLGDFIEDVEAISPPDSAARQGQLDQIREVLARLPGQEGLVLRWRFGFEDGVAHTLEEIGERLGFTRQRAEQIEKRALARLRKSAALRLALAKKTSMHELRQGLH
jgi:RNA polymerase primary sigma factor